MITDTAPLAGSKPRVLFVDDEPRVLSSMRMLFRSSYEVYFADGGQKALDQLKIQPVDVIVSDQRMPGMTGIELLRAAREINPHAMRILLTGYSDLTAIIGSVNEGEIFRFVNKPWANEVLTSTVANAAAAARASRAVAQRASMQDTQPVPVFEAAVAAQPTAVVAPAADATGVLVLDDDLAIPGHIQTALGSAYRVFGARTMEEAVNWLEQETIGVVISETRVQNQPVVNLIGTLKQHQPELVTVILTGRADAGAAIELINQGQIYRLITKPMQDVSCRIMVNSAQRHHQQLVKNPELQRRYDVEKPVEVVAAPAPTLRLLDRVRSLRSWMNGRAS